MLYFLAGLLPDPDGPWSPTLPHCYAWNIAVLVELVTAAVFVSEKNFIHLPPALLDSLCGLGIARIVVFGFMIALLSRRQYELRTTEKGPSSEHESLLENGEGGSNGYGGTNGNGNATKPEPKKPRDPQKSGWFEYIAGFRVLFPYLW